MRRTLWYERAASLAENRPLTRSALHLGSAAFLLLGAAAAAAQEGEERPVLRAGKLPADFRLDGVLDEPAWAEADAIRSLTGVIPDEGSLPSEPTIVRVLADPAALVIGILCRDSRPDGIVSRTMDRDASLDGQDHVHVVLGPFRDGRSGYVFTVNPSGARVDGLVASRGEGENRSWDGLWEAKTWRDEGGWGAEIRIPILTLSFRPGLREWHFNVERYLERLRETSRWAGARRDTRLTQTSHAGLLADLPEFTLGVGTTVRPALAARYGRPSPGAKMESDPDASLDVWQKLGPNLLLSLTYNTDFSETEVDARRTNLTRFPLFYPEKRTFFLEGSEFFDFGIGLNQDVVPFHSRTIGLVDNRQVPLLAGAKLHGVVGDTNIGALAVRTGEEEGAAPETSMGAARIRQNVLEESSVGLVAAAGDPRGRDGSWMAGTDLTYQTSRLWGDKNFLAGVWSLAMDREDLDGPGDTAFGAKIDYPNDVVDAFFNYKRVGREFEPSLGFVPRTGIHRVDTGVTYSYRPDLSWLRRVAVDARTTRVLGLDGGWESYWHQLIPLSLEFETGDYAEVMLHWQGERLPEDFEVAEGVVLPPGTYEWFDAHLILGSSPSRAVSGGCAFREGGFYGGTLREVEFWLTVNPVPLVTLSAFAERNAGRLDEGNFRRDLCSARLRLNLSPDLNLSTFVQYDTDSRLLGSFSRLRWTVTPASDLFVVFHYNWLEDGGELAPENYETALKVQVAFRF